MSADHGRWIRHRGHWLLEDPKSKNGTFVNGVRSVSAALHDGAIVEIGHRFLVFRECPVEALPACLTDDIDATRLPLWPPGLRTFCPALAAAFEGLVRGGPVGEDRLLQAVRDAAATPEPPRPELDDDGRALRAMLVELLTLHDGNG
jgi:hypothetical protein